MLVFQSRNPVYNHAVSVKVNASLGDVGGLPSHYRRSALPSVDLPVTRLAYLGTSKRARSYR